MRTFFTVDEALARGVTRSELRTGVRNRRWHYVARGVLVEGPARPNRMALMIAMRVTPSRRFATSSG